MTLYYIIAYLWTIISSSDDLQYDQRAQQCYTQSNNLAEMANILKSRDVEKLENHSIAQHVLTLYNMYEFHTSE